MADHEGQEPEWLVVHYVNDAVGLPDILATYHRFDDLRNDLDGFRQTHTDHYVYAATRTIYNKAATILGD